MPHEALAWHFPEDTRGEFCLIRIGLIVHRVRALPWAWRIGQAIDRATQEPAARSAGLLTSERIRLGWNHFGYLQCWRNVDDMLSWAHASPHTEWWRMAVERQRNRQDFSIYHETYSAAPGGFEAIYLNLAGARPGASAFGELRPPKGASATAMGRLGRIGAVNVTGEAAKIDPTRTESRGRQDGK